MKKISQILLWTGIFAVAMAFLESSVVVYLRALYYPGGFAFPLKMMDEHILVTEIFREAATMVMLFTVGIISARSWISRFAIFIYTFAIWDIFYYIFLVFLLGWPPSLFTWDLLFLIPVTWAGPVLAPVINSLTMILLAVLILRYKSRDETFRVTMYEWVLLITGSLIVIFAYTQPYVNYILQKFSFSQVVHFRGNQELMKFAAAFIPVKFNWIIFSLGQLLFFKSIYQMMRRKRIHS
jgi:hypothetical protein